MYKKIYNSMRMVALFVLAVAVLMFVGTSYTAFSNELHRKINDEGIVVRELIEACEDPVDVLKKADFADTNSRIILKDNDGNVLYDNAENSAAAMMYSSNSYLKNGYILMVGVQTDIILQLFLRIAPVIVFAVFLILVFTWKISHVITESIVNPIQNIYSLDPGKRENIYEELKPFLQRISGQNQEIERQMDKVRRQKLRLNTITENMSEGLVVLDENACVLSVNQSAMKLFGIHNKDVKYKSFEYISRDQELCGGIRTALNGEKNNITKDIADKTYRVFFSPAIEGKRVSGAVLLLLDVSELMRAEQIRREFSANVSHELKTPVTTIHGYAQIIKHGMAKPELLDNFIGKIEKESQRLIMLIEDIIKISNLDESKEIYEKSDVSLRTVAENVKEQLSEKAAERQITISISGEDSIVYANQSGIHEIIYNLCDNAIKYNKDRGSVYIKIDDNKISVIDTGIGIPEEYTDRIFERFFRVDKSHSKKVNGTGLGLSIVKHLIKKNDCDIQVQSKLGEGSEFTVTF